MSSAPPVFNSILGPNFLEDQAPRSAQQPKEIPLPDDGPQAMTRLCRLLHHQRDPLDPDSDSYQMHSSESKETFDLSLLADKCNCIAAIGPTTNHLF